MNSPMSSATSAAPSPEWAGRSRKSQASSRLTGTGRGRRVPYLVLGVLLVGGCALGGVLVGTQLGHREAVLMLSRPVTVGQVLSAQDIQQVTIAADGGFDPIPAVDLSTVVGQPFAFNLPAGVLLSRTELGSPQVPPTGQGVTAMALKPGQFPPGLAPGTRVMVIVTPGSGSASGVSGSSWTATVVGVQPQPDGQTTVVSVQLGDGAARQLAAASTGQVSLVAENGGNH